MRKEKEELDYRYKLFADNYIKHGIVEKAAVDAGYSKSYAKTGAYRLLDNVRIKEYVERQMKKMHKKTIAEAEEILEYLTKVMRGEEKDAFGLDIGISDRTKAAESLGKRYALFTERKEITGKDGGAIQTESAVKVYIPDNGR